MNSNWFKLVLKIEKVEFGKGLLLHGIPIIINKGSELKIGNNVTIKSSFLSNLVGLYSRTIILTRTPEARILIGDNVGISGATIYARESILIGNNTKIGGNTKIMDHDFHPIDPTERLEHPDSGMHVKPIKIGENVFIGCNCIILKGTKIGNNCVVGAGAVVSGKFEDNCIIAGNPARIIRKL